METRASYIAVGTFVIAIIAAALVFVIWLTGSDGGKSTVRYLVYFEGSVTGLQKGGTVRYRGVPVGTVTDIRIDPQNLEQIRVTVSLSRDTPVKTDTVATLGIQGITGLAYVQLTGGTQKSARLEPKPDERYAVIPSRTTGLQQIIEQVPQIVERVVTVSERLADLLGEKNTNAITETLENLRSLTGAVADRRADIDQIVTDARVALAALREASESVALLTTDVKGRVGPIADDAEKAVSQAQLTAADARKTVAAFRDVAEELAQLVDENRAPIRDFSSSGLYELSQFIAEARVLVSTLSRLSTQIERDPARFFFGDTQKGFEAR